MIFRPVPWLALALSAASTACAGMFPTAPHYDASAAQASAQAQANGSVDAMMVQRIDAARASAKAAPGATKEAYIFAKEVENAIQTGATKRAALDGAALVDEAFGYLDAAMRAQKDDATKLMAEKGSLLIVAGRKDEALTVLEQSIAVAPNLWALPRLLELYDGLGRKSDVRAICAKTRPTAKSDDERYAMLDRCMHYAHTSSSQIGLAWAPAGDVEFFDRRRAEDERQASADNEAWRAKRDAERQALNDSFSKPGASSTSTSARGASRGSSSVSLRSACSKTVRVFFGDKPKYGSGRTSSVSSNSVSSVTMAQGDNLWIVDDHDNGISSAQVGASTREIQIAADCRSFRTR